VAIVTMQFVSVPSPCENLGLEYIISIKTFQMLQTSMIYVKEITL